MGWQINVLLISSEFVMTVMYQDSGDSISSTSVKTLGDYRQVHLFFSPPLLQNKAKTLNSPQTVCLLR